jgi:CRP-like cAMP-binding protein
MTEKEAPDSSVSGREPSDEKSLAPTLNRAQALRVVTRRLELLVGGIRLSRSGISRLARYLDTEHFAAGEVILNYGERGNFMGLVGAGQVAVYDPTEEASLTLPDDSALALILQPGSTFGEAMLLDGRPCGSTLAALSGTQLYVLHRDDYLDVVAQRSSRPRRPSNPWWLWFVPLVLLALIALAVAAIYLTSTLESGTSVRGVRDLLPASPSLGKDALQVVKPEAGEVIQGSQAILVQAMLSEPGVMLAELQVDGWPQGRLANDDPDAAPWLPEWVWEDASSGSHVLAIRASPGGREWQTSAPITVTVVPSGTLVFSSNRDGPYAVYTMSSDGRRLARLTTGPGDSRQPAWRAAESLAFVVEPENGPSLVRQLSVGGSEAADMAVGRDPAWTLDGALLAYASAVEGVSQVLLYAEGESSPVQITEEEIYAGQPAWSPDGKVLAYVADRDGNWDIWSAAADGSEPQRLTTDAAMDWAPAWSPDGRYLAFVSNRGGSHQIHIMSAGGGEARPLTSLPQGAEAPAWSPDGLWLAFVAYTGDGVGVSAREIHLMRASGQDQVRLTFNAFDDSGPRWRRTP